MTNTNSPIRLKRERMDLVRRMQASVVAADPMLDAMCENVARRMAADAAVVTLLLEQEQVFIGSFGLRSSPGAMRRQHSDAMLVLHYFEELRMDENPAMARNPMVHGPHDSFRSVVTAPVLLEGAVVGALNLLWRRHRDAPCDAAELASLFAARDSIQAHLAFGVLIRTPHVA